MRAAGCRMTGSGGTIGQLHVASEVLQFAEQPRNGAVPMALIEVLWSEVTVWQAVTEHELGCGKHGGGDPRIAFLAPRRALRRRSCACR